jgi:hypothetical protein
MKNREEIYVPPAILFIYNIGLVILSIYIGYEVSIEIFFILINLRYLYLYSSLLVLIYQIIILYVYH